MTATPAARRRIGWSYTWMIVLLLRPAHAEGQANYSDWDTASGLCQPACRSGYECRQGECTPICSPSCSAGFVCSEGECVATDSGASSLPLVPVSRSTEPAADSCEPRCRSGYTCVSSRCVSLCNPVCGAGEACNEQGECVLNQLEEALDQPSLSSQEIDNSANSLVNLHLDVAGALQFGVTPTIEAGKQVSGYLQLRVMNSGLASYLTLGRDKADQFRLGVGAALGVHIFTAERGNMRGIYGGLALEYAYVETRDDTRSFVLHRIHALIPQADFGYRWAFGDFLLGVSAKLGLAIPVADHARPIGPAGCLNSTCNGAAMVAFIPGVAVDIGWFIPNGSRE